MPFRKAAVLGAGTMGSQIAAHLANAGLEVLLLDIPDTESGNRNAIVERGFKSASRLKPDPFFSDKVKERITLGNFDDDLEKISEADWVIEVVVEILDIKRNLLGRVEEVVAGGARFVQNLIVAVAVVADRRGANEHLRRLLHLC